MMARSADRNIMFNSRQDFNIVYTNQDKGTAATKFLRNLSTFWQPREIKSWIERFLPSRWKEAANKLEL